MAQPQQLLKPVEVRNVLQIGRTTYYRWIDQGILRPIRLTASCTRFDAADLAKLVSSSKRQARA